MAGSKEGNINLKFKDGTHIHFNDPLMVINGLTVGQQTQVYMNHVLIEDLTNNLVIDLHYNPWTDNTYQGMFKRGFKKAWGLTSWKKKQADPEERPKRADDVHIEIYMKPENAGKKTKDDKVVLSSGMGSWLSHVVMDDETLWRIEEYVPQWSPVADKLSDGTIVLPSDMEKRPDIPPMVEK